ncbi:hypothetical_protein [Leishmania infantum]|uniref:Hypothetical_protein n=1 Tax=Leishmania infantum TaxID=5671 RepID=A0A6L0XM21_LEIIN|nr:hypothetical_protein [Leishmania infantum]SUZ44019.1 hypothetical_protein [Leishmania infantum]
MHRSLASPCTECENSAQTSSSTAGKGQLKYDRSLDSDVLTPVARGLRQQCWEENSAAARLYKERAEEEHQLPAPHISEFVWSVLAHQLQKRDVNAKTAAEAPGTTGTPCGGAAGKGTEWRCRGGEHYADCSREASSRGGFRDDGRASWSTEDSQPNSVPLTREHDTMQHGSFIPQRLPLPCDEVTRSSPAQNPVPERTVRSASAPQASASSERLCCIEGDEWSCSGGSSYHVSGLPVRAPSPHPKALQCGGGGGSGYSFLSTDTCNEERSLEITPDLNATR